MTPWLPPPPRWLGPAFVPPLMNVWFSAEIGVTLDNNSSFRGMTGADLATWFREGAGIDSDGTLSDLIGVESTPFRKGGVGSANATSLISSFFGGMGVDLSCVDRLAGVCCVPSFLLVAGGNVDPSPLDGLTGMEFFSSFPNEVGVGLNSFSFDDLAGTGTFSVTTAGTDSDSLLPGWFGSTGCVGPLLEVAVAVPGAGRASFLVVESGGMGGGSIGGDGTGASKVGGRRELSEPEASVGMCCPGEVDKFAGGSLLRSLDLAGDGPDSTSFVEAELLAFSFGVTGLGSTCAVTSILSDPKAVEDGLCCVFDRLASTCWVSSLEFAGTRVMGEGPFISSFFDGLIDVVLVFSSPEKVGIDVGFPSLRGGSS